jgi:hypothetical protein
MGRQHGAQLGISIAALDMAPASTRSQATSKVLMEPGTSAVNGALAFGTGPLVQSTKPPSVLAIRRVSLALGEPLQSLTLG